MSLISILALSLLTPFIHPSNCKSGNDSCPLWHVHDGNGVCKCGATLNGVVRCDKEFIYIGHGNCMTWNNSTNEAEVHLCLFTHWKPNSSCATSGVRSTYAYRVPANIPVSSVDYLICKEYNRQGTRCRKCIDGYGPAIFSDGIVCANCAEHKHLWILNLLFQLGMVTAMYVSFILLQIKGASSPLNIIITYIQLGVIGVRLGARLKYRVVCYLGQTFTNIILSVFSVWNLDFFHEVWLFSEANE